MLEDFDEKPDGGEDLGVGVEIVAVRRTIHDSARASLVEELSLPEEPDDPLVRSSCSSYRRCMMEKMIGHAATARIRKARYGG